MRCARLTYPIQEAADPKDHFPPEHRTAEGKTEIETKQVQLGHAFAALLSLIVLIKTSSIPGCRGWRKASQKNEGKKRQGNVKRLYEKAWKQNLLCDAGLKFHKSRLHTNQERYLCVNQTGWGARGQKRTWLLAPLCCSGEARLKGLPGRRTVCLPKTTRLGRRIKQQRCSNELPPDGRKPRPSPRLPARLLERSPPSSSATLAPAVPPSRGPLLLLASPSFLALLWK